MAPHKRMWRAARDELLQDALLGKLQDPRSILEVATQDVREILMSGDRGYQKELTLYDLCVLTDEDTLSRFVSTNTPIVLWLVKYISIPRIQRRPLPYHEGPSQKAKTASGLSKHLFREVLLMCSMLRQAPPLVRLLHFHDKYFACEFVTNGTFVRECDEATRAYPQLFKLATRTAGDV